MYTSEPGKHIQGREDIERQQDYSIKGSENESSTGRSCMIMIKYATVTHYVEALSKYVWNTRATYQLFFT